MTEGVELAFHSWEKKQIADKEKADHHGERKILSSKIFRILYSQHNQEGFFFLNMQTRNVHVL